jgi:hypothetical protein
MGCVEVKRGVFLISKIRWWSAPRFRHFIAGERACCRHWIGTGWAPGPVWTLWLTEYFCLWKPATFSTYVYALQSILYLEARFGVLTDVSEKYCLLRCATMQSDRSLPTLREKVLPLFEGWRIRWTGLLFPCSAWVCWWKLKSCVCFEIPVGINFTPSFVCIGELNTITLGVFIYL